MKCHCLSCDMQPPPLREGSRQSAAPPTAPSTPHGTCLPTSAVILSSLCPFAATASVRGELAEGWAFHLHELGQGHWVAVARAPLSAVVDAWGVSGGLVGCWALCAHALGWEVFSVSTSIHVALRTLHRLPPPATHTPQGFKATFQKTTFASGEWQEELHATEPPFTMLSVADLVPQDQRAAYVAAGGELL